MLLTLSLSLLVKINLCYFVEFWSEERVLKWGLRFICLQPVEESYDKGSAFKMLKVRKSSRVVVVTFSVAGMKCKMMQRTYLFL